MAYELMHNNDAQYYPFSRLQLVVVWKLILMNQPIKIQIIIKWLF